MATSQDLLAEALELSVGERLSLATRLLQSVYSAEGVDGAEGQWAEDWSAELDRRARQIDDGKATLLDAKQVIGNIRADLKDR